MSNSKKPEKSCLLLVSLLTAFLLAGSEAVAQTTLVTVEGRVSDEEEVALPGAAIHVRNVDTGYAKSAVTRDDGRYLISGLQPGNYESEVSLPGFTTQIRRGMTFAVGSRLTLDFQLTRVTIEEQIIVIAESPMVEVTKSEVSAVIDRTKIDSLPLLDRDFNALSLGKAGVVIAGVFGARSNAQPLGSEEILTDGVSNEWVIRNIGRTLIPADAIQEFRVMTNQYEAEYGNASGMIRSAITRSGTNDWTGRLAFFYRDEILDDVNYFVKHEGYQGRKLSKDEYEKAPFSHYNYSGHIGGPLKKDKAHFFLLYEGISRETYTTITSPLVPRETVPQTTARHQVLAKFNYQFDEKNLMFFRYTLDKPSIRNDGGGGMWTKSTYHNRESHVDEFQLNWTHYPSDNTMNEARAFFSRHRFALHSVEEDIGRKSYFISRPSGAFGAPVNIPQEIPENRYQFVNNFSLFTGNHSFKFGIDASYVWAGGWVYNFVPGAYFFATDAPFDPANPATYPSVLITSPEVATIDIPYWAVGVFAQDSWRVTPRLTLNYGLRYNYFAVQFIDIDHLNIRHFNPRFGFSYDPIGDGKTAVRGGIGTYSQNPQLNLGLLINSSYLTIKRILFPGYPDPSIPNPFVPPREFDVPSDKYMGEPNTVCPYPVKSTLGFQREFITDLSIGVDLVYSRGYNFSRVEDDNAVIPGTGTRRPDPTQASIYVFRMAGKTDYRALYFTLSKRYSHGWSLDLSYTLSRSWSDVETEQTGAFDNEPDNWERMYGPNNHDATHRLALMGILDLPLGFQLSGFAYYRSALPWTAFYVGDVNLDGKMTNMVDDHRNARRSSDMFYLNLRLSKSINIDRFRIQLFAEAYNITNRVNFDSPFFRYGTPSFGNPTIAGSPRQVQLGARFDF